MMTSYFKTTGRTENRNAEVCVHITAGVYTPLSWLHLFRIGDLSSDN